MLLYQGRRFGERSNSLGGLVGAGVDRLEKSLPGKALQAPNAVSARVYKRASPGLLPLLLDWLAGICRCLDVMSTTSSSANRKSGDDALELVRLGSLSEWGM